MKASRIVFAFAAVALLAGGATWVTRGGPTTGASSAFAASSASGKASGAGSTSTALAVTVTTPLRLTWPQTLQATGALAPWQEAVIGAETGNLRIAELHADIGSRVKRGELLARLADDGPQADLRKQEALVAQARASLLQAQGNVARVRATNGSGAISGQKMDEYVVTEATSRASLAAAEADQLSAQIRLAQTRILAVDDGIVSSRSALLGSVVATGSELFRLVRQGRIEWQAELDPQQLERVATGQGASVTLPTGKTVEGRVRLIAPTLSTRTGRATAYVSLPTDRGVQAGIFASGSIDGPATQALTLPQSAIVMRDGRNDLYLLKDDGTAARHTVTTGRRRGDRVEVTAGLAPDARVIVSGAAFLSDGMAVTVVAQPASSARNGP
jgi:RND family efflux transporter MFP subunit